MAEVDAHRQRCGRAPFAARIGPAVVAEDVEVVLVGELRVRDRELALQVGPAERLEPLVGLGVDAGDEEARDGEHLARVAAAGDEPLEPAEVGLGDGRVALEREDQRHVDRDALRDAVLDRAEARLGGRDLHVEVRAVDLLVEAHRLLEGALAVVGERRVDLERDEAVDPVRALPDGAHAGRRPPGCRPSRARRRSRPGRRSSPRPRAAARRRGRPRRAPSGRSSGST